jgi:molybdopterin-biosynthesis enzyme MoeA-like protein
VTTKRTTPPGIGLIIIGTEILNGRRTDRHFDYCRERLAQHRLPLVYSLILTDDPALIETHLRGCMARPEPFFCCGGIGGTPDDYTRDCAARAVGVDVTPHPEGLAILTRRFGAPLTPGRQRMIEFPRGATLIPNPINEIPGFSIRNGHFVPGFPEMAQPMIAWVLDTYYEVGAEKRRHTLLLPGAREGDLTPAMERFVERFPDLSFSSLPRFTESGNEVELSLLGETVRAEAGMRVLRELLDQGGFAYNVTE